MLPEKTDLRHARQAVRTGGKPRKWYVGETSVWLFLFIYLIAVAYPLLWMAVSAFKSSDEIFEHSWSLPSVWHPENFVSAWNPRDFRLFYEQRHCDRADLSHHRICERLGGIRAGPFSI